MKKFFSVLGAIVFFAAALSASPWDNMGDAGGGWKSSWFGMIYPQGDWAHHQEHGWIYGVEGGGGSIWYWDQFLGWVWTGPGAYPFMYQNAEGNWLAYSQGGKVGGRWFYNTGNLSWQKEAESSGYAPSSIQTSFISKSLGDALAEVIPGAEMAFTGDNPWQFTISGYLSISGVPALVEVSGEISYATVGDGNSALITTLLQQMTIHFGEQTISGTMEYFHDLFGEPLPWKLETQLNFTDYSTGNYSETVSFYGAPQQTTTGEFRF